MSAPFPTRVSRRHACLSLAAGLFALPCRTEAASIDKPPAPSTRRATLFIVGDSTVRSAGRNSQWGWGERLAPWFDPDHVQLANHAMAGRSARTFLREGRWATVKAQLQPGDLVLIQFGHNDGGPVGDPAAKQRGALPGTGDETQAEDLPDGTVETVRTFGAYLSQYLRETLQAGALPVVLSPIPHKDHWQNGRDFADIAAWGQAVAQREGGLFLDLTLAITEAYQALGPAQVEPLFADANTHTNDAGAKLNAACLAGLLRGLPDAVVFPRPRSRPVSDSQGSAASSSMADTAPL
ncbi:Lysophospholipase L1 [Roseateles sp. YR242]|uniref:rhamnogalacturonan acetylesterase n=1 Tax=Roseateles sp. YR242 TaxID=1855305 RepID=UPI0008CA361F|nr:rhamnogalacturonan acetylesterase [Roseateles sp. YR242]SEK25903.1 Lysophospholipase L1 [Roseateles sp. YR242]